MLGNTSLQTTDYNEVNRSSYYQYNLMHPQAESKQPIVPDDIMLGHNNLQDNTGYLIVPDVIYDHLICEMFKSDAFDDTSHGVQDQIFTTAHCPTLRPFNTYLMLYWKIDNAQSNNEIIDVLGFAGLKSIAERLVYLEEITREPTDGESEEKPIEIESLRRSVKFIMENRQMPDPEIVVSHEGLVYLSWQLADDSVLNMGFLPSPLIRFVAILRNPGPNSKRWSVSGAMLVQDMMRAVKPFTDKLLHNE